MASRILQSAMATQKSRVAVCCAFILAAAVTTYSCPFASAAGVSTDNQYDYTGGLISVQEHWWAQSDKDATNPVLASGQEALEGGSKLVFSPSGEGILMNSP